MHFAHGIKAGQSGGNELKDGGPKKSAEQREAEKIMKQEAAATHRAARLEDEEGLPGQVEESKESDTARKTRKSLTQKLAEQVRGNSRARATVAYHNNSWRWSPKIVAPFSHALIVKSRRRGWWKRININRGGQ